jgi:hypothetical protein
LRAISPVKRSIVTPRAAGATEGECRGNVVPERDKLLCDIPDFFRELDACTPKAAARLCSPACETRYSLRTSICSVDHQAGKSVDRQACLALGRRGDLRRVMPLTY